MAPLTRRLIFSSFSIWRATRSSTTSSTPAASPASTIATYRRLKTSGWRPIASDSSAPDSTCSRTSSITVASTLSSVCCSRITSAVTTDRPASIIVANWREKTCSDFALTLPLVKPVFLAAGALSSSTHWASRPPPRSASRAAERSEAWISPVSSAPWALIALYAKEGMRVSYRRAMSTARVVMESSWSGSPTPWTSRTRRPRSDACWSVLVEKPSIVSGWVPV